jgi:hypothetical protein
VLLADPAPELDHEPLSVQVAVEVEQVRLHPALDAVEVRVRSDGDSGPPPAARAGVDRVGRDEKAFRHVEVRSRKAELAAAAVATDDDPLDLRGPPEQGGAPLDLARADELPDAARRDVLHERDPPYVEAESLEQREIALTAASEAERFACRHGFGADAAQHPLGELLGRKRRELLVEAEHEHVLDSGALEQLEPPLQRGKGLDLSAEHGARMRIEGHDARPQPGPPCRVDHPQMAAVDAVEGPNRDGASRLGQLRRLAGDVHAPGARAAAKRSRTSTSGRSHSAANASDATASSTENGPTAVRRSVAQCPPSAIASDRTYVPELT